MQKRKELEDSLYNIYKLNIDKQDTYRGNLIIAISIIGIFVFLCNGMIK